jgi:Mrp family chromosome partitioning ATPase
MKMGAITQFLNDVEWGELDYLVVDCPPGTGDEPLSICQALNGQATAALIVTTPQEVAASDVRRSVNFCHRMELPVAGIIENMSGFACPHCKKVTNIFNAGGGRKIAKDYDVPFLGELPISSGVGISGDEGKPFVEDESNSDTLKNFKNIVEKIISGYAKKKEN